MTLVAAPICCIKLLIWWLKIKLLNFQNINALFCTKKRSNVNIECKYRDCLDFEQQSSSFFIYLILGKSDALLKDFYHRFVSFLCSQVISCQKKVTFLDCSYPQFKVTLLVIKLSSPELKDTYVITGVLENKESYN